MPRVRKGPSGPKRSLAGRSGTNRPASAPKNSSGSKGGKMDNRMANKGTKGTYGGGTGPGAPY